MIYLVRHGEAAASWGAHPDPGLSEAGQAQAEAVAGLLVQHKLQQAYTSPMARCQATGAAYARLSGQPLSIEPSVTEIPTPSDIENRVTWLRGLMSGTWDEAPGIVQSWRNRLLETVESLPDDTVVFTHFVAINAIVGHLEGSDLVTVFRPNYCSQTLVERTPNGLTLLERGQSLETKVL